MQGSGGGVLRNYPFITIFGDILVGKGRRCLMINQIFAFKTKVEYERYEADINYLVEKFQQYELFLKENFKLIHIPKSIVWTSSELATTVFSNHPVPAFTNQHTIYMTPSVEEWRTFYLHQLEDEMLPKEAEIEELKQYFESITNDDVFCILAHELTHHIELFPDEFDEDRTDGIWFEEGMCEYLSQKFTLTQERYDKLRAIDKKMIALLKPKYGQFSIDQFEMSSYEQNSLASIMLNYWRSAAAIHHLVEERYAGNVKHVFDLYHEWYINGRKEKLTDYFGVNDF